MSVYVYACMCKSVCMYVLLLLYLCIVAENISRIDVRTVRVSRFICMSGYVYACICKSVCMYVLLDCESIKVHMYVSICVCMYVRVSDVRASRPMVGVIMIA